MKIVGDTEKRGTEVHFLPDTDIFQQNNDFHYEILSKRLRELSYLNKGVHIRITADANDVITRVQVGGQAVRVGEGTIFGSGAMVFDNDFHFPEGEWGWGYDTSREARPVRIGRGCFAHQGGNRRRSLRHQWPQTVHFGF